MQLDLPVMISWTEDGAGAGLEGGEAKKDGPVRVASMGRLDRNPYGGTHVASMGLVGVVTARKISRQKGVGWVSYEVSTEV